MGIRHQVWRSFLTTYPSPAIWRNAGGTQQRHRFSYTARYSRDFLNPLVNHPLSLALGLHTAFVVVGGLFLVGVGVAAAWRQTMGVQAEA